MRIKQLKIKLVSLATLLVLGTCSLVNGIPVTTAVSNQVASNFVFSRNFPHRHWPIPQVQQSQGTGTNTNTNTNTNTSLPENTQASENWAGYVATPTSSSGYTSVSGSWKVPSITADQDDAVAAQWIGLGGVSSSDLLQMGTVEQIENGQPVAQLFWEQLPSPAQYVMTVPIGSTISASISPAADSSSTWNLTFTINGQTQTQTIPPVALDTSYAQGIGTSAEWISEDPSNENSQLYPLADMGTVTYQSATVNGQPLNSSANKLQPIALVSSTGRVLIAPSALGTDGESFSTEVVNGNTTIGSGQGYSQQTPKLRPPSIWRHISDNQGYQVISISWSW
ncbi:peptidase A4 [Desulfosporosinus sp. PR]|uniref:G1 family glutamic endopeptidase n=1 Tax=Candidatus Desulfosporosinus nitrosoreducens TaxID=3401928 RepID=UPI0027F6DA87|nr:G1 family glutamic endopeptidase [Desulfosporosinus sp. PR]MDQ7097156.1 peptidase A4 [Desulfosporosinus sp. PR]